MSVLEDSVNIFMQENPFHVEVGTTAAELASFMKIEDIGTVIIVDESKVVGIVTDRDIVTKAIACGKDPETTGAADLMSKNLETINQYATCKEALDKMASCGFRRLPVVNDDNELVGIVSLSDLSCFIETNRNYMEDILSVISSDARFVRG